MADDKDLECPVCMEPYALVGDNQPRVLACSGAHELCAECISALPRVESKLVCPQCREHVVTSNPNRGLLAALQMNAASRAREATATAAAAAAEATVAAAERKAAQAERKLSRKSAEHERKAAERAAAMERTMAEKKETEQRMAAERAEREAAARKAVKARRNQLEIKVPLLPSVAVLAVVAGVFFLTGSGNAAGRMREHVRISLIGDFESRAFRNGWRRTARTAPWTRSLLWKPHRDWRRTISMEPMNSP